MLSSTVRDLLADREAARVALEATGLVQCVGVAPIEYDADPSSSFARTVEMAEDCDVYLLFLGGRYGYAGTAGKSATQLEYEAAYRADPTKVLIFQKAVPRVERRQREFIQAITRYESGYFVRKYSDPAELGDASRQSLERWLARRAAIGARLTFFDHFIRIAIQRSPFPGVQAEYSVSADTLEFAYRFGGRRFVIHFDKLHVLNDFWGSVAELERRFDEWRSA